ncbi:LacI family DNA-binding transcriptional regulator [Microbacterium saperdae]|uniref:LacI family transcriptional regulator n=1 Tax=Microbacterium saperdae TaxID=69368 RepID=A0A543BIV4_9MICO|nr:LacI family DNA-binding transcriptional regulator [Microbacterium saperdae]TQL84683.1 LacI family transcriptional regulator [Microbacterium saperdae]GGM64991.1 LacI family transcriptional regulator [Microbacterium saperdae]
MPRATIADIAKIAGVSKVSVSYALNGRAGVSDSTREKILRIADELGWTANIAARALTGSKVGAIGLVIAREPEPFGVEAFFMNFLAGIERVLSPHGVALVLQVVTDPADEVPTYRKWWAERRVDGVIVVEVRNEDARLAELDKIGMPYVVTGGGPGAGPSARHRVWSDTQEPMREIVRYLSELGHRNIAHVAGIRDLEHTVLRVDAVEQEARALGMSSITAYSDYSAAGGTSATSMLLATNPRPTALIYDNDVMAVAGLTHCMHEGIDVPGEVSLIAGDNSLLTDIVHPRLTSLSRDVANYGADACSRLLEVIDGDEARPVKAETARLRVAGSSGPAPRG